MALAQRLSHEHIDAIYSSDLRRARETGQDLARFKHLQVHTDLRLREGRWASQEVTNEFPTLPFPVEVEEREDVRIRMLEAMTDIACRHSDARVVVISHTGPAKQFVEHVRQFSADPSPEFRAVRAAINRIIHVDGVWSCRVLDDSSHLPVSPSPVLDT